MEEELTCPITLEIFEDPISVPCCGVSYSRIPFVQAFEYNKKCPSCRTLLSNFDPVKTPKNIIISKMISALSQQSKINKFDNIIDLIQTKQISREKYLTISKTDITSTIQETAFYHNLIKFEDLDLDKIDVNFITIFMNRLTKEQYKKMHKKFITKEAEFLALKHKIIEIEDCYDLNENYLIKIINDKLITNEKYKLLQERQKTLNVEKHAFKCNLINFDEILVKNNEMIKLLLELDNFSLDDIPPQYVTYEILDHISKHTSHVGIHEIEKDYKYVPSYGQPPPQMYFTIGDIRFYSVHTELYETNFDLNNDKNDKKMFNFIIKYSKQRRIFNKPSNNGFYIGSDVIAHEIDSIEHTKTKNRNYMAMIYIGKKIMECNESITRNDRSKDAILDLCPKIEKFIHSNLDALFLPNIFNVRRFRDMHNIRDKHERIDRFCVLKYYYHMMQIFLATF